MTTPAPEIQRPGVAAAATAGSALGGAAAGALLGSLACGEAGAVIGAVALVITFAAGYGMWSAYVLAQAHGSLLRLLWSAFLRRHERKTLDREEWRAEFAAMWARALRWTFLFWLNGRRLPWCWATACCSGASPGAGISSRRRSDARYRRLSVQSNSA
jgi:hypothetical protein